MEKQLEESDKKGAIVGIGNVLQSDDGIGVKILKYIEANYIFPDNVELIDGGTTGSALQTSVLGKQWLLIIDALITQGLPGDVKVIQGDEIAGRPSDLKLSPHQMSFFDLIQFMEFNGTGVDEFDIIGIIPSDTGVGTEITPLVDQSISKATELIMNWLDKKGINPQPVTTDVQPDYWWLK